MYSIQESGHAISTSHVLGTKSPLKKKEPNLLLV